MAKTGGTREGASTQGLEAAVEEARAAIHAVKASLEGYGLASLTSEERALSTGRLRDGEADALRCVLDTVDAHPEQFASLAPHDHGHDDGAVETSPSRIALARRAVLAPLAAELEELAHRVGDDVLASSALAKDMTLPAYAIIRANAKVNPTLRRSAAAALDFYAKQASQKPPSKPSKP